MPLNSACKNGEEGNFLFLGTGFESVAPPKPAARTPTVSVAEGLRDPSSLPGRAPGLLPPAPALPSRLYPSLVRVFLHVEGHMLHQPPGQRLFPISRREQT